MTRGRICEPFERAQEAELKAAARASKRKKQGKEPDPKPGSPEWFYDRGVRIG